MKSQETLVIYNINIIRYDWQPINVNANVNVRHKRKDEEDRIVKEQEEGRLKEWEKKVDEERKRKDEEQYIKEEELRLKEEERRQRFLSESKDPNKIN